MCVCVRVRAQENSLCSEKAHAISRAPGCPGKAPPGTLGGGKWASGQKLLFHGEPGSAREEVAAQGGRRVASIESSLPLPPLRWGHWNDPLQCPPGSYLIGFSLRVERVRRGVSDYMGATNLRFVCSDGRVLEGQGLPWGEYGAWSPSCRKGLCGIQTKQEAIRGVLMDDSALNDVRFFCCAE